MRALTYHGPRDVRVIDVPDPDLPDRRGAVVRVAAAGIVRRRHAVTRGRGIAVLGIALVVVLIAVTVVMMPRHRGR